MMGGTYNEPNTNLTSPETTIRNFVYGIGFQRDIIGADPATAWQLDVFGHDPQFPGHGRRGRADVAARGRAARTTSGGRCSAHGRAATAERMQFASEFEWIVAVRAAACSPTTCPPTTRRAGGWTRRPTLAEAEDADLRAVRVG